MERSSDSGAAVPPTTSGYVALGLALGCVTCDVLPTALAGVRLVERSADSVSTDYANGFAGLALYAALKLASVICGVLTLPAAFVAMRRGQRWLSRLSLLLLLGGLLLKGAQLRRDNAERGPAPPRERRAPRHCYEAALNGDPTPPDCVAPPAE